jgi:carboxylesterase
MREPPDRQAEPLPNRSAGQPRRLRRAFKRILIALPIIILIWVAGDFVYSRIVLYKLDRYESGLTWDEQGICAGAQAINIGTGRVGLLLIHGINFSPIAYRNMAPALADRGFQCRAMRLPGFGMRVREYETFDYQDWSDAIANELEILDAKHRPVFVVAHSLGGAVALRHVAEQHPPIAGIILIAPAIEVSNRRSPILPTRFWHEFSRRTLFFTRIVLSPFPYDLHDPDAVASIPQLQFTPRVIVDQTFALIDQNRGRAGDYQLPLLMILSPDDQVIDSAAAEAYYRDWGTDQKSLVWQRRAAHMIPLDFDWELAVDAISDFVAQHADPQPTGGTADERIK